MGLVTMKLRPYMAMLVDGPTKAVFGPKTAAKRKKTVRKPLKNRENRCIIKSSSSFIFLTVIFLEQHSK